ncbi:hypothetical protein K2173_007082 [Erythroxylum novogranatense]|uniref:Retrotransposon protein, putative, Ty1-copia subclass n=1 Tax=Erythroxylum novogranatense TaxID=1862640 RepID=A0AAV8SZI8_9ROSI|nr:hypothetical protein K2173_007082 [Erythroxylum novogranatense]
MTKAPFTGKGERANELLGLIHTDVCGPFSISARGGYFYFITFSDDFSRYGYVYLMKHKSESFEKFKEYKNEPEKEIEASSQAVDEQPSTTQGLRRSNRIRHEPERYGFLVTDDDNVMLIDHNEPTTYQKVMESPESAKWLEAMKAEMQSMYDNQVWKCAHL